MVMRRHLPMVYAVALREVQDTQLAEDICQAAFILLAQKASRLGSETIVGGWLCRAARNVAGNELKKKRRRERREQEAAMHRSQAEESESWNSLEPELHLALHHLKDADYDAVVLRFFENRSIREVGEALQISEMAAGKRVNRALEKLRSVLNRRGKAASIGTLMAALAGFTAVGFSEEAQKRVVNGVSAGLAGKTTGALLMLNSAAKSWLPVSLGLGVAAVTAIIVGGVYFARHEAAPMPTTQERASAKPDARVRTAAVSIREPMGLETEMSLTSPVGAVSIQPDGKILAGSTLGGFFVDSQSGTIGYYTRGAMRFQTNGALDRTFLCAIDRSGSTSAMASRVELLGDGSMFVTGIFNDVDQQPRAGQARIHPDGSLDAAFEPWRGITNMSSGSRAYLPGGVVTSAALPDGSIAVLSASLEGPRAPHPWTVYRLDATGKRLPAEWDKMDQWEFSRPSGLVLTLGPAGFWARKPVDWEKRSASARRAPFNKFGGASDLSANAPAVDLPFERWTEPPSALDASVVLRGLFQEVPLQMCRYAVRLANGDTILAVREKAIDGSITAPGRLLKFDRQWMPVAGFDVPFEADLRGWLSLKPQPDGKLLVHGLVGTLQERSFQGLARLNPDGSMDDSFACVTSTNLDGRVMDLVLQKDGCIIICGFFDHVNGKEVPHLARLHPDGSLDETFRTPFVPTGQLRRRPVRVQSLAAAVNSTAGPTNSVSALPGETVEITSLTLMPEAAVVEFRGVPGHIYILQANNSPGSTNWVSVSTNTAAASGSGRFRDAEASRWPARFYRVARP